MSLQHAGTPTIEAVDVDGDARRQVPPPAVAKFIGPPRPSLLERASTRRSLVSRNSLERRSSMNSIGIRDITAILRVSIRVDGYQFDSSIMEHPEFLITTKVVFKCRQYGGKQLETQWKIYRTFQEFQGLDSQLRQRFAFEMCEIQPPRLHRRRSFFRLHRTKGFLSKRCGELNDYLSQVLEGSTMRLTRFMDPRAPLILRCFCNFDAGFGRRLSIMPNQLDDCVLCLDDIDRRYSMDEASYDMLVNADEEVRLQEHELKQNKLRQHGPRGDRDGNDSMLNVLEANLLDDQGRNMVMCLRFECSCQRASFRVTENNMSRILTMRGYRQTYRPTEEGATALFCVLYHLQQYNDLDKRLYDILSLYTEAKTNSQCGTEACTDDCDVDPSDDPQLTAGVALLREALANYGLLYVYQLEPHFHKNIIDLKKKLHEFKNRQHHRVGAIELVLLCTMLDLSITLITNDHEGTIQDIFPLPGFEPIRRGGRMVLTLGYVLPTVYCVSGLYLLAEPLEPRLDPLKSNMWLGLEEMDRQLMALIERQMRQELDYMDPFDHDVAETLNKAILEAVWNDCHQNPNLFHLFQRQARQFGKLRTTATVFFQYLDVAFGLEGASYLVDFLLHVLPEVDLRKQLLRARWVRIHRHLAKRVAAVVA